MPAPIEEIVKRRVIQQWLAGEAREKIIADNDIAAGTVSIIVDNYKTGLDSFNLDSFRELTLEAKKRGMTPADLASFFRLYNFFRGSGAKENEVESFITNINSGYIPPDKAIELVNQLHTISKSESIPLDQVPGYIERKLEEKQKLDEQIREAETKLQTKNVNIQAINEHLALNEKLKQYGLSTQDIDKLLKILANAARYGFDGDRIASKLYDIQDLERKQRAMKNKCKGLSKQAARYNDLLALTEEIAAWGIGIEELLALKVGIIQAAKYYNLPPLAATLRLIDDIIEYNKINGLRKEISALYLQKYTIEQAYSRKSQPLGALATLKSYGLTEERILQLSNFVEDNAFKVSGYTSKR
jgi:hypothetical protein